MERVRGREPVKPGSLKPNAGTQLIEQIMKRYSDATSRLQHFLKASRVTRNWRQDDLSAYSYSKMPGKHGISRTHASRLEMGEVEPGTISLSIYHSLAKTFGVPMSALLKMVDYWYDPQEEGEPQPPELIIPSLIWEDEEKLHLIQLFIFTIAQQPSPNLRSDILRSEDEPENVESRRKLKQSIKERGSDPSGLPVNDQVTNTAEN